ncbi:uncharacterized protein LOC128239321 [Mya arenaria]|nr:uncharacterized protein LOC128239321 [Mya arenaria]
MHRDRRRGPPRKLEKMLFINHKEDQLLDARLAALRLQAKVKGMELDLERIKVRNELRASRKKQLTINEAIASGLFPGADEGLPNLRGGRRVSDFGTSGGNRPAGSAPSRGKGSSGLEPKSPEFSRSTSFVQPRGTVGSRNTNQFTRQPAIPEHDEIDINGSRDIKLASDDSVGAYVLGEFEKISQVVPEILRALAKKKEKQQAADELIRLREIRKQREIESISDLVEEYEPDMNKVRKTVGAVKKLRQRMSLSKRLEMPKKHKPLDQMIKDKTDEVGENDEYTDGTCSLMKRRLEKKRRGSAAFVLEPSFMQRRSSIVDGGASNGRRPSIAPEGLSRRASSLTQLPPALLRSSTTLSGMGSVNRPTAFGMSDNEEDSPLIDEDTLIFRQRVMRELDKYRALQARVTRFVDSTRAYARPSFPVWEGMVSIRHY